MALHWNIGEIADWENVCRINVREEDGEEVWDLNPVTDGLIWSTIGVGMGEITEDNYELFYQRMLALAAIHGPMLRNEDGSMAHTLADIKAHIGLKCNVSFQNRLEFQMGLGRRVWEETGYKLKAAKQALEAPVEQDVGD